MALLRRLFGWGSDKKNVARLEEFTFFTKGISIASKTACTRLGRIEQAILQLVDPPR
jgi:hypothetical protein